MENVGTGDKKEIPVLQGKISKTIENNVNTKLQYILGRIQDINNNIVL